MCPLWGGFLEVQGVSRPMLPSLEHTIGKNSQLCHFFLELNFCARYPDKEYMKQYEGKCVLWDEEFVGRFI